MKRLITGGVLLLVLSAPLGGCVGLAAIGAAEAFSLGVGAADAGASVFKAGKLHSAHMAPYGDVVAATFRAGDAMGLSVQRENVRPERAFVRFEDETGKTGSVRIERRTEVLTYLRIDVGLFGSGPFAKLFLQRVAHELVKAGAYYDEGAHPIEAPGGSVFSR